MEAKLKDGSMTPIETNMLMRQLQSDLMAKKMQAMLKQKSEAEKAASLEQLKVSEDEEEHLKKTEIAD